MKNDGTLSKFAELLDTHVETKKIKYKGYSIQTYLIGRGKNVIFSFPAYPHSGLIYLRFLEQYPDADVKFITFDLPGWIGLSENLFREDEFTMAECVNIALEILDAYKVNKYSLIGYSFGTALATILSHFDKERVQRLVLVSPVVNCRIMKKSGNAVKVDIAQRVGVPSVVKSYVKYRYHKYKKLLRESGFKEEFIKEYETFLNAANGKVLLDSLYKLFHTDLTMYFDCLGNMEVMVVNSKNETKMFREQAAFIRRHLNDEISLYISGNHEDFVLKSNPKTAKHVLQFLAGAKER